MQQTRQLVTVFVCFHFPHQSTSTLLGADGSQLEGPLGLFTYSVWETQVGSLSLNISETLFRKEAVQCFVSLSSKKSFWYLIVYLQVDDVGINMDLCPGDNHRSGASLSYAEHTNKSIVVHNWYFGFIKVLSFIFKYLKIATIKTFFFWHFTGQGTR